MLPPEIPLQIERPQIAPRVTDYELIVPCNRRINPGAFLQHTDAGMVLIVVRIKATEFLYRDGDRCPIVEMAGIECR